MKIKLYTILTLLLSVFHISCAESKKEIIIRYHLPKEVLANIAEFMPANSKFVNYMARVSKLSDKKYKEIVYALIFGKMLNINNSSVYQNIKIAYDYDDIDSLLNRYFKTTPFEISKINNRFLQKKIRKILVNILDIFPEIAFKAQLEKLDINGINRVINRDLSCTLSLIKQINTTGDIDLSNKNNELLALIAYTIGVRERTYLIICSQMLNGLDSSVKTLLTMHESKINVVIRILSLLCFWYFYAKLFDELYNFSPIIAILCAIPTSYILSKDLIIYFTRTKPNMTYRDLHNTTQLINVLKSDLEVVLHKFMIKYRQKMLDQQ